MNKILIVCSGSLFSGLEMMNLNLMNYLIQHNYDILCLTSGWNNMVFHEKLEESGIKYKSVKLGYLYIRKPLWTMDTLINAPISIVKSFKIIRDFNPDVIIINDPRMIYFYNYLWRHKNVIFWEHNIPSLTKVSKSYYSKVNKISKYIVCCSFFVKQKLFEIIKDDKKLFVIHNGVKNDKKFNSNREGIETSILKIGIIGQIIPRKMHLTLINALEVLVKSGYKYELLIYGNDKTDYALNIKKHISGKPYSKYISWKGFEVNLDKIYSNIDLVVIPSIDEPFGLVALEPAFWGVPVIAANSGGLSEIIIDNYSGILFKQGDHIDLSTKIIELIENFKLRKYLIETSFQHINTHFNVDKMGQEFEKMFKKIKQN